MNERQGSFPVTIFSFGYKYGPPQDVNLLFDVRFLANPFHVPDLRAHNGTESIISDFVLQNSAGELCLEHLKRTICFYIEELERNNKDELRVGIGCTGGHHRSVAVTEALAMGLAQYTSAASFFHRDIEKESH